MVQIIKNKIEKKTDPGLEPAKTAETARPEAEKIIPPEVKVEAEKPLVPEAEKPAPRAPETAEKPPVALPPLAPSAPPRPPKSEVLIKIEKILEEDLVEFYFKMPPEQRKIFKEKGEETASRIEKMIEAGKTAARKILKLIREWLKLIPGVNKFFLEQEAKIKTDRIMIVAERKDKKRIS